MSSQVSRQGPKRASQAYVALFTVISAAVLTSMAAACTGSSVGSPAGSSVADPNAPPPAATAPSFEPAAAPGGLTIDRPSGWWAANEDESLLLLVGPEVTSAEHFGADDPSFMAACGLANGGESPEGALNAFLESATYEGFVVVDGPAAGELGSLDPSKTLVVTLDHDGGDGQGNFISPALRMIAAAAPGANDQACVFMARGEQAAWDTLGPVFEAMLGSVRAGE